MKEFLVTYWIVGCALAGGAVGTHAALCPYDKDPSAMETAAVIVAWPAFLVGISFAGPEWRANAHHPKCEQH